MPAPEAPLQPAIPPDRPYALIEPLGVGGQGTTYRGRDTQSGREVAIKVFDLSSVNADGWKAFDLFERECEVLRRLKHGGIPDYLDYFADEAGGRFFLVMELMPGRSLEQLLNKPLDDEALLAILRQALDILEYLHGRTPPVIHRDIKPANLVLGNDGNLALVDFGGVRVATRPEGGSTVIGTFGYMAPEQLHGAAEPATDVFGLGATLAALAMGQDAEKLPRKGLKIDLRAMRPGPLRAVLEKMLEPDPDARLKDASAVRRALEAELKPPPPARDGDEDLDLDEADYLFDDDDRELDRMVEDELAERRGPPRIQVTGLLSFVFWLASTVTHVALYFVGSIVLPLVFGALGYKKPAHTKRKLRHAKDRTRRRLAHTRSKLRAIADRHDPDNGRRKAPKTPKAPRPPRPPRMPHRHYRGRRGR